MTRFKRKLRWYKDYFRGHLMFNTEERRNHFIYMEERWGEEWYDYIRRS
jgi:hypothetical protein